jgi:hypothetical protein
MRIVFQTISLVSVLPEASANLYFFFDCSRQHRKLSLQSSKTFERIIKSAESARMWLTTARRTRNEMLNLRYMNLLGCHPTKITAEFPLLLRECCKWPGSLHTQCICKGWNPHWPWWLVLHIQAFNISLFLKTRFIVFRSIKISHKFYGVVLIWLAIRPERRTSEDGKPNRCCTTCVIWSSAC